jgi:hypothetical protein
MDMLFESNLGYIECDVCGSGYNSVRVFYDNYAPVDTPFTFERRSNCYENITTNQLSRDELISLMDQSKFLIATRYARRNWREFMRDLQRGRYDKGIYGPTETLRATIAPAAVYELPEPEDFRCMDSCCNPDHPQYVHPTQYESVPQVYVAPEGTVDPFAPRLADLTVIDPTAVTWRWAAEESPF